MNNFELYIENLKSEQKSSHTIRAYSTAINSLLTLINKSENEITYQDLISWKSSISNLSSASMNQKIAAVKDYFRFLKKIKVIDENIALDLDNVKIEIKEQESLTVDEIKNMIENSKNKRDKAIIYLLATTAIRFDEMRNIKLKDFLNNDNEITILGKGNKERKIYLNDNAKEYIYDYLNNRKESKSEFLFVSNNDTQMDNQTLNNTLKVICKRAGINKDVHCHMFRRSKATQLSSDGIPTATIMFVLGHSDISTTMRYINKDKASIASAMMNNNF